MLVWSHDIIHIQQKHDSRCGCCAAAAAAAVVPSTQLFIEASIGLQVGAERLSQITANIIMGQLEQVGTKNKFRMLANQIYEYHVQKKYGKHRTYRIICTAAVHIHTRMMCTRNEKQRKEDARCRLGSITLSPHLRPAARRPMHGVRRCCPKSKRPQEWPRPWRSACAPL